MDFTTHPFYPEENSVMYVLPPAKDRYDIFIKPFKYQVRFMLCVYGVFFHREITCLNFREFSFAFSFLSSVEVAQI